MAAPLAFGPQPGAGAGLIGARHRTPGLTRGSSENSWDPMDFHGFYHGIFADISWEFTNEPWDFMVSSI